MPDPIPINLASMLGLLKKAGFDERADQTKMMETVWRTFENHEICVIEGGTGIGKTFGYLVPLLTLLHLKKTKNQKPAPVVISTATVQLQSQLIKHDLPNLLKLLPLAPFQVQLAKGRGRYLCPSKLFKYLNEEQTHLALFGVEDAEPAYIQKNQAEAQELSTLFETETWNGDYDELPFQIPHTVWRSFTTDSAGCSNRQCQFFQRCPYFKNKKKLVEADIIITNHDLFLSDISLGTGSLLPKAAQCFYIIDEAHHLPQKSIDHFSVHCSLHSINKWGELLNKLLSHIDPQVKELKTLQPHFARCLQTLKDTVKEIFNWTRAAHTELNHPEVWLMQTWPQALSPWGNTLIQEAQLLLDLLTHLQEKLSQNYTSQTLNQYDTTLVNLGFLIDRYHYLMRSWQLLLTTPAPTAPPIAKWLTPKVLDQGYIDYTFHAALTDSGQLLFHQFWKQLKLGAVLCSATLRALGSFEDFLNHTGLAALNTVQTLAFPSPFPYHESRLVIPTMRHSPDEKNRELHTLEIVEHLEKIFKQESHGVLVLFTSHQTLIKVYETLPAEWTKKILVQTHYSKEQLLNLHRQRVDEGRLSIIFGLQSYAEGVDLKGAYCEHLVITKLPFSVPNTPIEQTRQNWLKSLGKDPFLTHALPEASVRLTQFVGRLIRHHNDRGTVTILDSRLKTKFYGQRLLDNLPQFTIVK